MVLKMANNTTPPAFVENGVIQRSRILNVAKELNPEVNLKLISRLEVLKAAREHISRFMENGPVYMLRLTPADVKFMRNETKFNRDVVSVNNYPSLLRNQWLFSILHSDDIDNKCVKLEELQDFLAMVEENIDFAEHCD